MDHLLRTLAAVPYTDRVLDWHAADEDRLLALARLGFDVHVCHTDADRVGSLRRRLAQERDDAHSRVVTAKPSALGYPDAYFDWVVGWRPFALAQDGKAAREQLKEALRVMKDGAWIYLAVPAKVAPTAAESEKAAEPGNGVASSEPLCFTTASLDAVAHGAGFATAERPALDRDADGPLVRAIYRKTSDRTPL